MLNQVILVGKLVEKHKDCIVLNILNTDNTNTEIVVEVSGDFKKAIDNHAKIGSIIGTKAVLKNSVENALKLVAQKVTFINK